MTLVFYQQSQSDWQVYQHLVAEKSHPICHQLHYLQMSTEKLAKAYFLVPSRHHGGFVNFVGDLKTNPKAWTALGFADLTAFSQWQDSVRAIVAAVEDLAPALADRKGLPNPEYPWPKGAETTAPVNYPFQTEIFDRLDRQRRSGQPEFLAVVDRMVATMQRDAWHL